jgi:uncharacterized membrane protein
MNLAHLHLLLNHFPIIGTFFAAAFLIAGMLMKENKYQVAAAYILMFTLVMSAGAYFTGDPAEDAVKKLGTCANTEAIEEHDDMAKFGLITMILLGAGSAVAVWMNSKKDVRVVRIYQFLTITTIICFLLMSYIGYLGGKIHHPEIQ